MNSSSNVASDSTNVARLASQQTYESDYAAADGDFVADMVATAIHTGHPGATVAAVAGLLTPIPGVGSDRWTVARKVLDLSAEPRPVKLSKASAVRPLFVAAIDGTEVADHLVKRWGSAAAGNGTNLICVANALALATEPLLGAAVATERTRKSGRVARSMHTVFVEQVVPQLVAATPGETPIRDIAENLAWNLAWLATRDADEVDSEASDEAHDEVAAVVKAVANGNWADAGRAALFAGAGPWRQPGEDA